MKTRSSKLVGILSLLAMAFWAMGPRVAAQTQLTIQMTPRITVTGTPGTCAMEWAQVLGGATNWLPLTNVVLAGAPLVFYDTAAGNSDRRFYRAVLSCPTPLTNMVWITPGTFTMGSPDSEVDRGSDEGPQTVVTLTRGFWMGRYEVTQGEYNFRFFRDLLVI